MKKLQATLVAIDAANAGDPTQENGTPAALVYGHRMSGELQRLYPKASEPLQIAARGQHIERWLIPRTTYPVGKAGYYAWRRDLAQRHAARVSEIMQVAGYSEVDRAAAAKMLCKKDIKLDDDVQALEDTICFVFLKWYFAPFAAKHDDAKVLDIVRKTARKMSDSARARVLKEFDLPEPLAAAFSG